VTRCQQCQRELPLPGLCSDCEVWVHPRRARRGHVLDLGLTIQAQREVGPVLRAAPPPRLAAGIIAKMKAKWGWK